MVVSEFEELSIGVFARRVGLTPSALRFYDDCGLLRPRRVDAASGYRYYGPEQEPRGRLLRDLRRAGLPLPEARTVLDGPPARARDVLDGHLRRTRERARAAAQAVAGVLRTLPTAPVPPATARVGGPELSAAVRQVTPAALTATGPAAPAAGGAAGPVAADSGGSASPGVSVGDVPAATVAGDAGEPVALGGGVDAMMGVLRGLLFEVVDGEVRVVATDRYRLAVRVLRSSEPAGGTARVVVDSAAARRLAAWAARATEVILDVTPTALLAHDPAVPGAAGLSFAALDGTYPDYTLVLDGLAPTRTRLIAGRAALRDALAVHHAAPHVTLTSRPSGPDDNRGADACDAATSIGEAPGGEGTDALWVEAPGRAGVSLPVVRTGDAVGLAFDPVVLAAAVDAGVGPDVLLEIAGPCAPVVVRSADQGTFTTLAMPVRAGKEVSVGG